MNDIPIAYPGRFAPGMAIGFSDGFGRAIQVSPSEPLPVTVAAAAAGTTQPAPALSGTTATTLTAGPFTPVAGKPLVLALTGTWSGTVRLLRSTNGGTTKLPVTLAGAAWAVYVGNVCEPVWEEAEAGAVFYLQLAPTSGTINYRLAQ